MKFKITRTTPYPYGREYKDKDHACYIISVKNIVIKLSVWEQYHCPEFSITCHPSNAVNSPALQYFKDQRSCDWFHKTRDNRTNVSMNFLDDILTRDEKIATKTDLINIRSALQQVFTKIDRRCEIWRKKHA